MITALTLWWPGGVGWSDGRDWEAGNATAREALDRSPHRGEFREVLTRFTAKANRCEHVEVCWWVAPFIYLMVRDDRYHYPCNARALVSFELTGGTWSSYPARRRYTFARPGWGALLDSFAGCQGRVPRYGQCSEPARPASCPPGELFG
jgi:hypothetical protein